ncbi:MAG: BamA/TamA family outer membrane protein [Candidatus Obscuribacterales bacterium]|nr:BamA/TamA family outer membrane protein [Candidatus Obscuribacterales bacterium]
MKQRRYQAITLSLTALLSWQTLSPVFAQDSLDSAPSPDSIPSDLTIHNVTVEGNRLIPTEDILNVVKTKPGDKFDRDQVMTDLKAVNSMGYFDDRNLQVVPELNSGGVLLKIRVQENAPVTQFAFQGNNALSTEEISKSFSDQLGKPQNLNQLSSAIDKVEQTYHEKGYLLARVVDVKDDPDGSIGMTINEGVIEKVEIVGNHKTKDFIIKNAIKVKPGSVYNERDLTTALRKLYANGYFQDIRRSLTPNPTDPNKYTLKVEVDEKRTGSVGLGGGVDTVAGPFGSFSVSDANFRGRGQVVQMNAQIGSGMLNSLSNTVNNGGNKFLSNRRTYQLEGSWIEPNLMGSKTSLALNAFARDFNSMTIDYSQQQTFGLGATFTRPLAKHTTANLGLLGETTKLFDVGNFANNMNTTEYLTQQALQQGFTNNPTTAYQMANQVRNQQLQGGTYATFSPSIQYDTRDSMSDPHKGSVARLSGGPSLGLAGPSFMRLGASVSKYVPVTRNSNLAFNFQGGAAMGGMPQFAMYRLGGYNGLRGYRQFTDLGTGSSMLMATAEYRFKIPMPKGSGSSVYNYVANKVNKHARLALFTDAGAVGGNAMTNDFFQRGTIGASAGIGLRLNLPMVGVIRLDYGFPLLSTALGKMTPRFTVGFGDKF